MSEQAQPTNEAPEVQFQSGWLSPDAAEELKSELAHSYTEWQKVRSQAWGLCDAIRNDMVPTVVRTLADMLLRELEQREPSPEIVEMAKDWGDVDAETKLGELNTARAEIETLRQQLENAQRELSEQGQAHSVELQQETADLRQQLDAALASLTGQRLNAELRGHELERLRAFVASVRRVDEAWCEGENVVDYVLGLQLALDKLHAETEPTPVAEPTPCPKCERLQAEARATIADLRQQLDAARAALVNVRKRLNEETDRHRATNAEKVDLFQKLQWANQHNVELVRERDAAHQTILAQRAGIERLRRFVGGVEGALGAFQSISPDTCCDQIARCLSELEDSPAPVAEPARCPECETTPQKLADANKQWQLVAQQREEDRKKLREYEQAIAQGNSVMDAARKKIAEQEAQVADLNDKLAAKALAGASNLCREIKRLQAFVNEVREARDNYRWPDSWDAILTALTELDAGTEPAPVAEPAEKQWFRSHVQIDGCDGSTVNEKPYWESAWVLVSGQPAYWRQLARRGDSQIPEWVWESLGLQMLCHAETRFNSQTNMMEFRNWEQRSTPTPVAEPARCLECERLRAELETANEHRTDLVLFVDKVRKSFRVWGGDQSFFDSVSHALDELDTNSSATLTSSVVKESLTPAPVAEPLDAEGGK